MSLQQWQLKLAIFYHTRPVSLFAISYPVSDEKYTFPFDTLHVDNMHVEYDK